MKGGFNNPPNALLDETLADRNDPSMKGGFNNPPNQEPKKVMTRPIGPFNEGGVQ